jgi:hypothetical protein
MKMPSPKLLAVNAGLFLIMGSAAVLQVRQWIHGRTEAVCSGRYNKMTSLSLERGGRPLLPSDIQAASFGLDHGVMNNLSIRMLKDAPASAAYGVQIEAGSAQPTGNLNPQGGVSFPWRPRGTAATIESACLSYNVFLPADFDFDAGGTLPGLLATRRDDVTAEANRVETRLVWGAGGTTHALAQFTKGGTPGQRITRAEGHMTTALPRGRWFNVEQELVLNVPQSPTGAVRIWIDGDLRAELKDLDLRAVPDLFVQGAEGAVHFGRPLFGQTHYPGRAKKTERVWITPFELRWK